MIGRLTILFLLVLGSLLTLWLSFRPIPAFSRIVSLLGKDEDADRQFIDSNLAELNRPGVSILIDLRKIYDLVERNKLLLEDARGSVLEENRDIVRALQGANRLGTVVLPRQHPTINERGEWVDRWGTPFYFRRLANGSLEIRSAGEDQRFWTNDDAYYPVLKATHSAPQ